MTLPRMAVRLLTVATATVLAAATVAVPSAQAHTRSGLGTRSLAAVLTKDTSGFDRNGRDFDVLTAAVLAVLKAKPASPVKVLTDGKVALTAFIPDDNAFRRLAAEVTHKRNWPSEKKAFATVAGLGIDTVEAVLLYHVVPGATITKRQALRSDNASLTTAAGSTVRVDVRRHYRVYLIDKDRNDANARVTTFDINRGNRQIAHAVSRVLRPVDLP